MALALSFEYKQTFVMWPFANVSSWSVKTDSSQLFPSSCYICSTLCFCSNPPLLVCVKVLGGPLIWGFIRPQSLWVSYTAGGWTLNKCGKDRHEFSFRVCTAYALCFVASFMYVYSLGSFWGFSVEILQPLTTQTRTDFFEMFDRYLHWRSSRMKQVVF